MMWKMSTGMHLHNTIAVLILAIVLCLSTVNCQATCPPLTAPNDGSISYGLAVETNGGYDIGDVATFSCDNNFILSGSTTSTCQSDYTWDNSEPTCQATCPSLTAPDDGSISYDLTVQTNGGYGVGAVATFSCDANFDLSGSTTSTCQGDHTWDNSEPTCQGGFSCADLSMFFTEIACAPDGSFAPVQCSGMECNCVNTMTGDVLRQIPFSQRDTFNCSAPPCPPLTAPNDGSISYGLAVETNGGYDIGDVATFSCDNNFILSGSTTSTCQSDYTWDNSEPTCQATCPSLTAPDDGSISYDLTVQTNGGYGVGAVATFSCDANFDLSGSTTSTCQGDHTWDNSEPTCQATCPSLTAPDDGSISYDLTVQTNGGYGVGAVATFSCDANFDLSGSTTSTCQGDNTWDNSEPTCQASEVTTAVPGVTTIIPGVTTAEEDLQTTETTASQATDALVDSSDPTNPLSDGAMSVHVTLGALSLLVLSMLSVLLG
ncbi:E-selectin-like isoform X2 [Halichondria panicea]|uniref:E-selectin-like isoform X2 n=1 Tax=Halichondria panicea TaxID=6063 RepID=UPI00312B8491